MKTELIRITWYEESINIKGHMGPYQYFRARLDSHNVVGINYAAQYVLRSKYVGWALVLNNE